MQGPSFWFWVLMLRASGVYHFARRKCFLQCLRFCASFEWRTATLRPFAVLWGMKSYPLKKLEYISHEIFGFLSWTNFRISCPNFIQNPVSRTFSLPWFSMVVLGAKPFLSGMDTSVLTWLSLTPRQLARVSLAGRTFGWSVRSSPFGGLVAKNPNRLTTDIWTPRWAARTSHRLMKMLAPMKCNFNRTMKSVKLGRAGNPFKKIVFDVVFVWSMGKYN